MLHTYMYLITSSLIVKPYRFHRRDMYLPATCLVDKEGKLKWLYVGKRNTDRPSREQILQQLSKL